MKIGDERWFRDDWKPCSQDIISFNFIKVLSCHNIIIRTYHMCRPRIGWFSLQIQIPSLHRSFMISKHYTKDQLPHDFMVSDKAHKITAFMVSCCWLIHVHIKVHIYKHVWSDLYMYRDLCMYAWKRKQEVASMVTYCCKWCLNIKPTHWTNQSLQHSTGCRMNKSRSSGLTYWLQPQFPAQIPMTTESTFKQEDFLYSIHACALILFS